MNKQLCEICGSDKHVSLYKKTNQLLCGKHRQHMNTYGKILERTLQTSNEIILYDDYAEICLYNKDREVIAKSIIDKEDVGKIKPFKWSLRNGDSNLYVFCHAKKIHLHKFLLNCPNNLMVDHINRDGLDNRKSNLRIVNNQLNSFNSSINKNNKSGVIGVCWTKRENKWRAFITKDKQIHLGYYDDLEKAIKARLNGELKYFGKEFAPQRHLFKQYGIDNLKIISDFDSVIGLTHMAVISMYRLDTGDYGTEVNDENLVWNMGDVCRYWNKEQIEEVFTNPKLFEFMQSIPNSIETLEEFHKQGDYIEVCSCHKIGEGAEAKRKWIETKIRFIDKTTIIPIENGLQKFDKSSVEGDVVIDDRVDCILSSPCKYKILFGGYTWNRDFDVTSIPNCYRAKDWNEVKKIINRIKEGEE